MKGSLSKEKVRHLSAIDSNQTDNKQRSQVVNFTGIVVLLKEVIFFFFWLEEGEGIEHCGLYTLKLQLKCF